VSKTNLEALDAHLAALAEQRREERAAAATAADWIEWAFEPSEKVKEVVAHLRRAAGREEVGHG
jgi:hypothetical protein